MSSKHRKSTDSSSGSREKMAAGSSGESEPTNKVAGGALDLQSTLAQMSAVLEEAKEFLKQQKKPFGGGVGGFGGEVGAKRALVPVNEQDEQDMNWISADDFSGVGKKMGAVPPQSAADKKMLAEYNTFKSVFGSRGLPFPLLSTEYMPASLDKQPIPLVVTDKDLKFIVLLLMQETLYAGMLQDWEHSLGGRNSLKLLQETLSILSLAQVCSIGCENIHMIPYSRIHQICLWEYTYTIPYSSSWEYTYTIPYSSSWEYRYTIPYSSSWEYTHDTIQ